MESPMHFFRLLPLIAILFAACSSAAPSTPIAVDSAYEWQKRSAVMPTPRSEMAAAVIDNLIYVPGGYDSTSNASDRLEVYVPVSDAWASLTLMPAPRHHVMATSYDGKLYVFGG